MRKFNFKKLLSLALALIISFGVVAPTVSLTATAQTTRAVANTTETIITTGGYNAYSLFNSGATSAGGHEYRDASTDAQANPNSKSYTNNGYDIFGDSPYGSRLVVGMGLSFYISAEVTERATLTVYAYDIDEESNQIDYVYLVDVTTGQKTNIGNLKGMDEKWTTTTLYIDPQMFQVGHTYRFENSIKDGGWWTWIRRVSIEMAMDGEVVPTPDRVTITERSFSASIDTYGNVTTDLHLATTQDTTYTLEYTATINSAQKGGVAGQTMSVGEGGTNKTVSFRLESGAPRGTYQITVVVKDARGNTAATLTAMAGYNARAITYNSNGGSSNVPFDNKDYATGETATVLFNYIPSRTGYKFLGWSTDKDAKQPTYTSDGLKTLTVGQSDIVLYAVWLDMTCHHEYSLTSKRAASCTADGLAVYTCSKCQQTKSEVLNKTGHSYSQKGICQRCGGIEKTTDIWDGTVDISWYDPTKSSFKISSAAQLAGLAFLVNSGNTFSGKTIYLTVNIDLSGLDWTPIGVGTLSLDIALAFEKNCFAGIFDGGNHTVSNLKINNTAYNFAGLFGVATSTIKNLGVVNSDISTTLTSGGYTAYCGSIAGLVSGGAIENCYAENSTVLSNAGTLAATGGIAGVVDAGGKIYACFATGSVGGNGYTAGIAGIIIFGEISICHYSGNVQNTGNVPAGYTRPEVGGIANALSQSSAKISDSFFLGELSSTTANAYIGGINGDGRGIIINCYFYTPSSSVINRVNGTQVTKQNLQNQSWLNQNLGQSFGTVWTFTQGGTSPVLKAFITITFHIHEFTESSRTPASCTGYGEALLVCECGEEMRAPIAPTGHEYELKGETPATCDGEGKIIFVCKDCNTEKEQKTDKLGHLYGNDNICDRCSHEIIIHDHILTDTVVEPTCLASGYTEHSCECGYSYRDSFVEQLGHAWDEGEVTTEKSCTQSGILTKGCERCDATVEEEIPAGHEFVEEILYEATCTDDGSKSKTCTACQHSEFEVIPAGHAWETESVVTVASCKTAGLEIRVCSACEERGEFEIEALGHLYENGICQRCEKSFIEDIAKSDHLIYGMHFKVDDILSNYGPDEINEYGVLLDYNEDAEIARVAVYLEQVGTVWRRCIAVVGRNIKYANYVPYLAYGTDIKYTGLNNDWINVFPLAENENGIWCYNDFVTIGVNLQDAEGNLLLSLYNIGEAGSKTKIFDDLDEMITWLGETTDCEEHIEGDWIIDKEADCTPGSRHTECINPYCGTIIKREEIAPVYAHIAGEWIVDAEPTVTTAGARHKECTACGEVMEEGTMAPLSTITVESVTAKAGSEIKLAVTIANNPGISAARLTITFDTRLTLVGITAGNAWSALTLTQPTELISGCTLVFDGTDSVADKNGTVVILTFALPSDAELGDEYEISLSYEDGDILDADSNAIDADIVSGKITVGELLGDANADGVVDIADVITLRRYIAGGYGVTLDISSVDMNADGEITEEDVTLLRRQLLN